MRNKAEETEKIEFVEKKVRKVNILQKIFIVHESSVSKICFRSLEKNKKIISVIITK